jgi:hypothetical protein
VRQAIARIRRAGGGRSEAMYPTNDLERQLVDAVESGVVVGPENSPRAADREEWAPESAVHADLIYQLLVLDAGSQRPRRALRLRGALIIGRLDLEGSDLGCPVVMEGCYFEEPPVLDQARVPAIGMPGCHMPGLAARQIETRGNVELNHGFTCEGCVQLLSAHIGGDLVLSGATLTNNRGPALSADGMKVAQSVFCDDDFSSTGEVAMRGAQIGRLVFSGARLNNESGPALHADRLIVDHSVFCDQGFSATGEVRLLAAQVGGQVTFDGATLTNEGGRALHADLAQVEQSVFFEHGFSATGAVRLVDMRIGGRLVCADATFSNQKGPGLDASGVEVKRDMSCGQGFRANGGVRLVDAHIGGELGLGGATITSQRGRALNAVGLEVKRDLWCDRGFSAAGEVRLVDARIGEELSFMDARLDGGDTTALDLEGASASRLVLTFAEAPRGAVRVKNARVGHLSDDPALWPADRELAGFSYETLERHDGVGERLRWVAPSSGRFEPEVFDQLAAFYRGSGREEDGRKVGLAKQRRRTKALSSPPAKAWGWLLDGTIGYGYRTWLAGVWLLLFFVVGWAIFAGWLMLDSPTMEPTKDTGLPDFHAWVYSLDVLVPIVDFGQEKSYTPQGDARYWLYFSIGAGWILTTAVVAALTGLLKRDV